GDCCRLLRLAMQTDNFMAPNVKQRQKPMTDATRRSDQKYPHGRVSWVLHGPTDAGVFSWWIDSIPNQATIAAGLLAPSISVASASSTSASCRRFSASSLENANSPPCRDL